MKVTEEDYRAMQIRSAISAGVMLPPQAMDCSICLPAIHCTARFRAVGLKLDPRKAPLEVLVIDQADKKPTEN